jgi:hypothetical protein
MITVENSNRTNKRTTIFVCFFEHNTKLVEILYTAQKSFLLILIISVQMSSNYHHQLVHLAYDFVSFPWLEHVQINPIHQEQTNSISTKVSFSSIMNKMIRIRYFQSSLLQYK